MTNKEIRDRIKQIRSQKFVDDLDYNEIEGLQEQLKNETAKEMFEEMGYRRIDISTHFNEQIKYENNNSTIFFNVIGKNFYTYYSGMSGVSPLFINMKLNEAIQKQIEELGWNK